MGALINSAELSTALTDFALGTLAAWCAYRLMRLARNGHQRSVAWWSAAFTVLAVSAVTGGIYHGIVWPLEDVWPVALWKLTVYGIGAFNYKALLGSAAACLTGRRRIVFNGINMAVFAFYAWWMLTHNDFKFVIFYSAAAMIGVLALHIGFARRAPSTPWMSAAVVVSAVAAVVQHSGMALHARFNHNDLYHAVQIVGVYLLYRGARRLSDLNAKTPTSSPE